ncbi:hypothetical protein TVAG_132670 [Trichomonas vaginalis G3]|uniref:Uncharacterized protein n=1 Tax=Trichomonas vaginalis (strain ATCC PRA-98 / G3) TaxID=412133 RepID=A2FSA6_TRIV3|nr:hypothetical protein TVAGG3_0210030 [Trichomonas vaginalis G3]EAX92222.1 hypothetical protein TVAG_132670 [Trichomonas vaginalis G3]KAI5551168.1 hypothetical protein TVAGG3_0210030 [Trichomonas vaginalis G3]|eukprot:XP_001305152.1 hypothetical protein [Trichomonas vaginalis G3]
MSDITFTEEEINAEMNNISDEEVLEQINKEIQEGMHKKLEDKKYKENLERLNKILMNLDKWKTLITSQLQKYSEIVDSSKSKNPNIKSEVTSDMLRESINDKQRFIDLIQQFEDSVKNSTAN